MHKEIIKKTYWNDLLTIKFTKKTTLRELHFGDSFDYGNLTTHAFKKKFASSQTILIICAVTILLKWMKCSISVNNIRTYHQFLSDWIFWMIKVVHFIEPSFQNYFSKDFWHFEYHLWRIYIFLYVITPIINRTKI
jgi:hypothetical protein